MKAFRLRLIGYAVTLILLTGFFVVPYRCQMALIIPPPSDADSIAGVNPEILRLYDSTIKARSRDSVADSGRSIVFTPFHKMDIAERRMEDSLASIMHFGGSDTICICRGFKPVAKGILGGQIIWMDTIAFRAAVKYIRKCRIKQYGKTI